MSNINDDLKRILDALAYQNAGEFLPLRKKKRLLGSKDKQLHSAQRTKALIKHPPPPKRIALISDGRNTTSTVEFVIESGLRQSGDCQIDILTHAIPDKGSIKALKHHISGFGLSCKLVELGANALIDTIDYMHNHSSLVFLVAMADDAIARSLVKIMPHSGEHIPTPIVLIDAKKPCNSANTKQDRCPQP